MQTDASNLIRQRISVREDQKSLTSGHPTVIFGRLGMPCHND